MPKERARVSAEGLADYFTNYLFRRYQGSRHVRRTASWVGLIVLGIEKIATEDSTVPRVRQLEFTFWQPNIQGAIQAPGGKAWRH